MFNFRISAAARISQDSLEVQPYLPDGRVKTSQLCIKPKAVFKQQKRNLIQKWGDAF